MAEAVAGSGRGTWLGLGSVGGTESGHLVGLVANIDGS